MIILTKEEAIAALDAIDGTDTELAHAEADDVLRHYLRAVGDDSVASAWDRCRERAGGFWYA